MSNKFNHEDSIMYLDGEYMHSSKANISIANTGFMYGLAVFTGMRAFKNPETNNLNLFRPQAHFERMKFSCKTLRYHNFQKNYSQAQFVEIIKELIIRNDIKDDVYIRVTNFTKDNKVTPKFVGYEDSLSIFLYPLGDYIPTGGMKCKVSSWSRTRDNSIPARCKINGLYVNSAFAKTEALLDGYDEALFLNERGHVIEGSAENFFMVRDGVLITPPVTDEILEGITRASILEIAKDKGITCLERSIARSELMKADEIFLTGTGAKVCPVTEVDKYPVGSGTVGPISKLLQDSYLSAARGELVEYRHWVEEIEIVGSI